MSNVSAICGPCRRDPTSIHGSDPAPRVESRAVDGGQHEHELRATLRGHGQGGP